MNEMGRKLSVGVGLYLCAKQILNIILGGFGGGNLVLLIFGAAATLCFWKGVKASNLVVAVVMMLIACSFLPNNIRNFNLLYLIEGVLDMLGAVLLAFNPDIREHCQMKK